MIYRIFIIPHALDKSVLKQHKKDNKWKSICNKNVKFNSIENNNAMERDITN